MDLIISSLKLLMAMTVKCPSKRGLRFRRSISLRVIADTSCGEKRDLDVSISKACKKKEDLGICMSKACIKKGDFGINMSTSKLIRADVK